MSSKPFSVIVEAEIKEDRMEEFMKMIENNALKSREEPGCIRFGMSFVMHLLILLDGWSCWQEIPVGRDGLIFHFWNSQIIGLYLPYYFPITDENWSPFLLYHVDVLRDQSKETKFWFYEVYESSEAVNFHKTQEHYQSWADFKESGGTVSSVSHKADGEFIGGKA